MAEDNKSELNYQFYSISFKIITDNLLNTNDLQAFYAIRTPLHKVSSFAIITCAIENSLYVTIENYIRLNMTVMCEITLNLVDHTKNVPGTSAEKQIVKELFKKTYYLDYCKLVGTDPAIKNNRSLMPVVNFFLINPAIWYLSTHKMYNMLFENKTAMQVLEEIEKAISLDFKDTFNFKDYRLGVEANKYKYEQLLVRAANDLLTPINIIKNYKVINKFSYYFFDDFYYTSNLKSNLIPVFFIALDRKTPFNKIDINGEQYKDFVSSTKLVEITPITDKYDFFKNDTKKNHLISADNNNEWKFTFNKEKSKIPVFTGKNKSDKNKDEDFGRLQYQQDFTFQQTEKSNGNDILKIYSPERGSPDSSLERFSLCSDLYRNQLLSICNFESDNVFIDLLQFNCIYNLEANNISDFSHVPINIVNIFYKRSVSEKIYRHSAKFQTLQFKPTSVDGNLVETY